MHYVYFTVKLIEHFVECLVIRVAISDTSGQLLHSVLIHRFSPMLV